MEPLPLSYILVWIPICAGTHILMNYWGMLRSEEFNRSDSDLPNLREGWISGRMMDYSDLQWRSWREHFLPILVPGMVVFLVASHAVRRANLSYFRSVCSRQIAFYNLVSFAIMAYLHGTSSLFMIAIVLANYTMVKLAGTHNLTPFLVWGLNLAFMFLAEIYSGFRFGSIFGERLAFLDQHWGLLRWHRSFNLCVLRLISFGMDHYWAATNRPGDKSLIGKGGYLARAETTLAPEDYSLSNFVAYVFYFPLYIAGPIVSFNAFVSQVRSSQTELSNFTLFKMTISTIFYYYLIEVAHHYIYFVSMNDSGMWKQFPAWEVMWTGYYTLHFMYIKFLLIWRFFRAWAGFDGVLTPDNMSRCINNCPTIASFWRSWHGSLNKWIVRYIYVPLGGPKYQLVTAPIIFSFIGLWHDLILRWQAWAMINCVAFSIEGLILKYFQRKQLEWLRRAPYYKYVCAAGGAVACYLLCVSNLAIMHGFGGIYEFLCASIVTEEGPKSTFLAFIYFYAMAMCILEGREREFKAGLIKKF